MPKHTLFVCQSCHRSSEERPKDQPADGAFLLEQLNTPGTEHIQSNEFEIQPSAACGRATNRALLPSPLPTNRPTCSQTCQLMRPLLCFSSVNSISIANPGDVPGQQFPKALQLVSVAKIPAIE